MYVNLPKNQTEANTLPNWLDIEWTVKNRIENLQVVTSFSSADWTKYHKGIANNEKPSTELWCVFILINCDSKLSAMRMWKSFIRSETNFDCNIIKE
jgi:hypothetical protein